MRVNLRHLARALEFGIFIVWRLCPDGQHGRERPCYVVRQRDPGPPAAETVTRPSLLRLHRFIA
jgi:hypothetical protein